MIEFNNEVVLVTGGGRGIGRAISELFARRGARVALTYHTRKEDAGETVETIVESGGEARAFQVDLVS